MLVHGANTLLTYYHHAHGGSSAFSAPWSSVEKSCGLGDQEKAYLKDLHALIHRQPVQYVHHPAKELFWTSQLFMKEWRPVSLVLA